MQLRKIVRKRPKYRKTKHNDSMISAKKWRLTWLDVQQLINDKEQTVFWKNKIILGSKITDSLSKHSVSLPPFCWGNNFQPHILKKAWSEKIRMPGGDLKTYCDRYVFGGLTNFNSNYLKPQRQRFKKLSSNGFWWI